MKKKHLKFSKKNNKTTEREKERERERERGKENIEINNLEGQKNNFMKLKKNKKRRKFWGKFLHSPKKRGKKYCLKLKLGIKGNQGRK